MASKETLLDTTALDKRQTIVENNFHERVLPSRKKSILANVTFIYLLKYLFAKFSLPNVRRVLHNYRVFVFYKKKFKAVLLKVTISAICFFGNICFVVSMVTRWPFLLDIFIYLSKLRKVWAKNIFLANLNK